mgnify:CR=1 FL=1
MPFVIDDSTPANQLFDPVIDGHRMRRGLVPRDRTTYPVPMFAPPSEITLFPRSEWDARIDEQEQQQSSLQHIFSRSTDLPIKYLHQNGHGYCWAYSTGNALMLLRALNNQPYIRLNPHAVAAIIKRGRDEGGWCGLSAQFLRDVGIPTETFWKVHSRDTKQDTAGMRVNAAAHKVTEDFVDLTNDVYDRNLTTDQLASCLLQNIPCALDYNEWVHSVCAARWVRIEKGSYGPRILNSWLRWGENGFGDIQRSWTVDSAVALRVTSASPL